MRTNGKGHFRKLPLSLSPTRVSATPQVPCKQGEITERIQEIKKAVSLRNYVPPELTTKNMAMMTDYIIGALDQEQILLDLEEENFVAKILDVGDGKKQGKTNKSQQEYFYVFQYFCILPKRELDGDKTIYENVLIYIKIKFHATANKTIIKSFHKNDA